MLRMLRRQAAAFLVCLLFVSLATASGTRTLSVRADQWYPLNGDPDSDRPGFAVEILRRIYSEAGIKLDYRLADWSRSLEMAEQGRIDCVIGVYRSEAPALAYPRTPLAWDVAALYVASGSDWHYQGLSSLEAVSLGVIADYGYGVPLDDYIAENRGSERVQFMHGRQPLRRNLKKLISGRVDVLVESPFVMESLLRRMNLTARVHEAGRVGRRTPLYLGCHPDMEDAEAILRRFDQGMEALRKQGELRAIMEAYQLPEEVISGSPEPGGAK
jgi:polar amino acid transport system substrate-binding protein